MDESIAGRPARDPLSVPLYRTSPIISLSLPPGHTPCPAADAPRCMPLLLHACLQVGSGGLVRDPAVHRQVIDRVVGAYEAAGFSCQGWRESPIKGAASGNTEFISYFQRRQEGEAAAAEPAAAAAASDAAD